MRRRACGGISTPPASLRRTCTQRFRGCNVLTDAQKTALQAVAMDMWEPYIGATRAGLPDGDAKIVFDRFHTHIMRDMTKAVDTVRKQEHRAVVRAGDDSLLRDPR